MLASRKLVVVRAGLVALLLTNGSSQALVHSHAGGHDRHTHVDDAPGACAAHHHDHAVTHQHDVALAGATGHTHFALFGIELCSVPLPDAPADEPSSDEQPLHRITSSITETLAPQNAGPDWQRICLPVTHEQNGVALPNWSQVTGRCVMAPVLAAPLCDAARHERSGVQLI